MVFQPELLNPEQLIFARNDWRQILAQDYDTVAERLLSAYQRTLPPLRETERALSQRIADMVAAEIQPTAQRIRELNEYRELLRRVDFEMQQFAAIVRNEAGTLSEQAIIIGRDAAQDMAVSTSGNAARLVASVWNRPDPEALARLIGYVDSDAFRANWQQFGQNVSRQLGDVILSAVAQGKNPRFIAGMLENFWAVPYSWAENTTRTVQLWSYRTASHATYQVNDNIVRAWLWWASLDDRTCPSCIAQHGTEHPLTESLGDHHRGRCVEIPLIYGVDRSGRFQTGQEWFEEQPEAQQRQIMGRAMWSAFRDGEVAWSDLSRPYQDTVYGSMTGTPSLLELLGSRANQYYARP